MKNFESALAIDPEVLSRNPNDYIAFNIWGLCLMDDRKYAEASQVFERLVRINPKFAPSRVNLGNALFASEHEDAALKQYLAALALEPKDFLTLHNVGLIYARQGRFKLAAKHLRRAHEISPSDKDTSLALMGAELSLGRAREGEREKQMAADEDS
jgi:tetratricopeptide (TPR) repeat protein